MPPSWSSLKTLYPKFLVFSMQVMSFEPEISQRKIKWNEEKLNFYIQKHQMILIVQL